MVGGEEERRLREHEHRVRRLSSSLDVDDPFLIEPRLSSLLLCFRPPPFVPSSRSLSLNTHYLNPRVPLATLFKSKTGFLLDGE